MQGQRDSDPTYIAARTLVRGCLFDPATALGLLLAHYNPRCRPEWSVPELEHKLRDAAAKPFNKPDGWVYRDDRADHPQAITPDLSLNPTGPGAAPAAGGGGRSSSR